MKKFKDMLYERVDFDAYEARMKELTEALSSAASGAEQMEIHLKYYELKDWTETMFTLAHLRNKIDSSDVFYKKEKEYCDKILPMCENLIVEYQKTLFSSPFCEELKSQIGEVAFCNIELKIKSFDERLVPLLQQENTLVSEYNSVIAGAEIEWEGETLNLSLLKPYLTHSDREIRRKAHLKSSAFFSSVSDQLDSIFDELVKNRTKQAKTLGYQNYIELGYLKMTRNCYDQKMVENFRSQVKEYFVPFTQKLHERRRERLGLDRLSYIDQDVYFKEGNPKPEGSPGEIMEAARKMYHELSPETADFIDFMMEYELFDVLGRKTKQAGGSASRLPVYRAPFIFANFNGTSGDVNVMTHECGHAFQDYLAFDIPIREKTEITMETAEVHSMSMEFFTEPWMKLFFGERTEEYLDSHLESCAFFIPYGCMVDEFQHIIYAKPELTPVQRNKEWRKLEMIYLPHLRYEDNEYLSGGGFWQRQLHIYNYPFYYIDYCLAQILAFQFKAKMDEDYKSAWESYLRFCRLSASGFFTDMIKQVGLESPFEDGCLRTIVEKLEA